MSKISTNLTRMAVSKNAHTKLALIYSKNLRVLAKMPTDYAYRYSIILFINNIKLSILFFTFNCCFFSCRKHTEQIVSARAALVKSVTDVAELETKINGGQIEEVVIQAENELNLSRKILEWKSWEPLIAEAPANQWKWPI